MPVVTIRPVATGLVSPTLEVGRVRPTTRARAVPTAGLEGSLRTLWRVGLVVIGIQFVLLLLHSWYLYGHFDLTADFGQYSQAWQQIATGHLNPYDTTYPWNYPHVGYPFYQGDFELIMWPLSLLYWVWPHPIDLLVVQDVALAGAGLVAFRWALEHLQLHSPNSRFSLIVGGSVLGIAVLQPWTYWAATYDYHSEPLAAFFLLLAGRDLWNGRRRGWIWVVGVLLCGNVAASYVAALGVAVIISGRTRWRTGLALVAVGVAWLAIVGLVHSGKGAALGAYAYLAGRSTVNDSIGGIATIVGGIVAHPSVAHHVVATRFGQIYKFVGGAGTAGIFSAFGGVVALVVLTPSALNSSPGFISDVGGAQNILAVLAIIVGLPMLATWLTRVGRGRRGWSVALSALALVLCVGALIQTAAESAYWTPKAGQTFARVDGATAAELAAVSDRIPGNAETVVSQGVVGRFAQRHLFYPYMEVYANGQTVPVFGRTVYVVLVPDQGLESESPAVTRSAIALMQRLGARPLARSHDVYAFAWTVPRGQHSLTFPA